MVIKWRRKSNNCGFEDTDKKTSFLFAKNKAWYDNDGKNDNNNNNNNKNTTKTTKQQQQQQQQQQNNNKNSNNNQPVLVKQTPENAKKLNGLGMIRVGRFFQLFPATFSILKN